MKTYKLYFLTFVSSVVFAFSIEASQLPDFSELSDEVSPAVVNISSSKKVKSRSYGNRGDFSDPFFDDFYKKFFGDAPRQDPRREREVRSGGSGFIISKDGFILTNNHVIDGADEIIVSLSDRREFKAELIGSDSRSDVALLKVKAEDLPYLEIGSSSNLRVGEWVMAIGSPFQLNFSVTAGIVSAKGRSIPNGSDSTYVPFIQSDVAINPGNSGGPLFNLKGEVVGINSQIYTRSGGYMGVSFSIPIDYAMDIVEQLKDSGEVARGWLGVTIQEITRDFAQSLGMEVPKGALISQVLEGSPADDSGLKARDVIIKFDGQDIIYSGDLPQTVGSIRPGKKVKAIVIRDAKEVELTIKVGKAPTKLGSITQPEEENKNIIGIKVRSLNSEERKNLGIRFGLMVTEVNQNSPASETGIQPNDVITYLENEKITSVKQFEDLISDAKEANNMVMIGFLRNGNQTFRSLRLTK
ncbi:MAG: DegQ family serine endoprotease [Gammaproteobacteria bacterium]